MRFIHRELFAAFPSHVKAGVRSVKQLRSIAANEKDLFVLCRNCKMRRVHIRLLKEALKKKDGHNATRVVNSLGRASFM